MKTQTKKIRKELIYRIVAVLACTITLAAASFSWFTLNYLVNIDGPKLKVEVTQNLVISDSPENAAATQDTVYSFTGEQQVLKECTHNRTEWSIETATGLVYLVNTGDVSAYTGLTSTKTPEYAAVATEQTGRQYYKDYIVYLSSMGKPLPLKHLYARLGYINDVVPESVPDYFRASSVDFYVGTDAKSNYRGTLNLAGIDYKNREVQITRVDLNGNADPETQPLIIPYQKDVTQNSIKVIMRFYFDGALEKAAGQTYIYADDLKLGAYGLQVSFEGIDANKSEN